MSGRLVSAVFASPLPARLKPYAAVLASYAADDGSRIYPTVATVAAAAGRSERSTQRAIAELRRRHVLELAGQAGPQQATRYRLNEAALSVAGDGESWAFLQDVLPFPQADQEKRSEKRRFPQFPQASTGRQCHRRGDSSVTRSVSDPSLSTSTAARARASGKYPKTGTA